MIDRFLPVPSQLTKRTLLSFIASCLVVFSFTVANGADEVIETPAEVERWYAALGAVDRKAFGELIADDAKIMLKDLGVEQTKDEFISALDEWEITTRNATMVYRYSDYDDVSASVLVCYRFDGNQQLILETFTFANLQITGSVQEPKGDNCDAF